MRAICFYFQVHQPFRLRRYRFFDISNDHHYFDDYANRSILRKVAEKCYLPMNNVLLDLIKEYGANFKVSFSISGTALDQFELYAPDVLKSFQKLANTGSVEFLAETYSHSLSALKDKNEFMRQVTQQAEKINKLFGQKPKTFRNTELIYSDNIGEMVADLGFEQMLTEGAKHILGWRSSNFLYCNAINPKLKLLLKNYQLSDDIAFRFSNQAWSSWPLTTDKYIEWLNNINPKEEVVNLFMDYETFGEHQWADSGIFEFMRHLPGKVLSNTNFKFKTPSEVAASLQPVSPIHVPFPISWADEERDLTAWLGNELQNDAFEKLYSLSELIKDCDDENLLKDWKYLQTSDHFYYMCTKWFSDGDVHKYFNPYDSPYEAFINFMNILSDFIERLENYSSNKKNVAKPLNKLENKEKKLPLKKVKKAITPKQVVKAKSTAKKSVVEKKQAVKKKLEVKKVAAKKTSTKTNSSSITNSKKKK